MPKRDISPDIVARSICRHTRTHLETFKQRNIEEMEGGEDEWRSDRVGSRGENRPISRWPELLSMRCQARGRSEIIVPIIEQICSFLSLPENKSKKFQKRQWVCRIGNNRKNNQEVYVIDSRIKSRSAMALNERSRAGAINLHHAIDRNLIEDETPNWAVKIRNWLSGTAQTRAY